MRSSKTRWWRRAGRTKRWRNRPARLPDSCLPFLRGDLPTSRTPEGRRKLQPRGGGELEQLGEDDQAVVVGMAGRVEGPGAGNQIEEAAAGRTEDPERGEAA